MTRSTLLQTSFASSRASISLVMVCAFATSAALGGCAGRQKQPETPMETPAPAVEVQHNRRAVDLNKDNRPDVFNYYDESGTRLIRKENDLNFDGRIDVVSYFEGGRLSKQDFDADFDGKVNWTDHYGADGMRAWQEADSDFDGVMDLWRFYDAGKLIRKERDTNGDGKADWFEYYENDTVTRIGIDTDGDGKEDKWL